MNKKKCEGIPRETSNSYVNFPRSTKPHFHTLVLICPSGFEKGGKKTHLSLTNGEIMAYFNGN